MDKNMNILKKNVLNKKKSKNNYLIKKWYNYYKIHLQYLYSNLLDIANANNINIIDDKDTYNDFVLTIYENSFNRQIPKNLLNIII